MWCRLVWRASFQIRDGIGTTGMPWMATQDATEGEQETTEESVPEEGFAGISGTGGVEAATAGGAEEGVFDGREQQLITAHQEGSSLSGKAWRGGFHAVVAMLWQSS